MRKGTTCFLQIYVLKLQAADERGSAFICGCNERLRTAKAGFYRICSIKERLPLCLTE